MGASGLSLGRGGASVGGSTVGGGDFTLGKGTGGAGHTPIGEAGFNSGEAGRKPVGPIVGAGSVPEGATVPSGSWGIGDFGGRLGSGLGVFVSG